MFALSRCPEASPEAITVMANRTLHRSSMLSAVYLTVAVICIVVCNVYIVMHQSHPVGTTQPSPSANTFSSLLERFILLPGPFGDGESLNFYPFLPWWPLCLVGCAAAPWFGSSAEKAHRGALYMGSTLLCVFMALR